MNIKTRLLVLSLPVVALGCNNCPDNLSNLVGKGELDPTTLSFGVVRAGATCTKNLVVRNVGQQDLTVQSASLRDDGSGGALQVQSFPSENLLAGGEGNIVITYAPQNPTTALQVATLEVGTNGTENGGKLRATISGEASSAAAGKLFPECKVRLADDTAGLCQLLDFGSTPKVEQGGAGGINRQILVRNDGTAPFNIVAVNVVPSDGATAPVEFFVDTINNMTPGGAVAVLPQREGDCGEPLANVPNGIAVSIRFTPTRVGVQTARVQIITDAPTAGTGEGNPSAGVAHVTVTGVGSGVGLGIDPDFISFGSVAQGNTETRPIRVFNLDINPAAVNTACIDINDNGTCYMDPACTSGCAADPDDVECTGGDADAATGLNCDVVAFGKGFPLERTDAMAGGADEATINVTWAPPAAASFSKRLLLMSNVQGNRTYSIQLVGGVAGNIQVDNSQVVIPASNDTPTATGSGAFSVSNTGEAALVITRIEFQGSASIADDFTLTRNGDASFNMSCTRAANMSTCMVPPFVGAITLAPNESTTFNIAFADNDAVVSLQNLSIALTHNGTGGNPFIVDVDVCKPASGSSMRPTCP